MTVSHVRQEKVSKCGRVSRDLLPTIATPQSGQCWMGGRGWKAIEPYLRQPGACTVASIRRLFRSI